jgi:hypothetical protein
MQLPMNAVAPTRDAWEHCIVWILESEMPRADAIARSIGANLAMERALRTKCLAVSASMSGANFVSNVHYFYQQLFAISAL